MSANRKSDQDKSQARMSPGSRKRLLREGLFYELQLNGPAPDRMFFSLDDPYKPDPDRVEALLADWRKALEADDEGVIEKEGWQAPWLDAPAGTGPFRRLQEFAFLRDLRATGAGAKETGRAIVDGWLQLYGSYDADLWEPGLTAERLWSSFSHGGWLSEGSDALWRSRFLTALARQARHLSKAVPKLDHPASRLVAAMSLTAAGLILPYHKSCEEQGSALLRRELRLQLRADGGHISRNPSFQLALALRLQLLVSAYEQRDREPPNFLHHAVGRTTDMVEFFRCGDGRLAVFNGGWEDDARALAGVLAYETANRSRIDFASQSGYQRLTGARTYVFVDAGSRGRQIQTRPLLHGAPAPAFNGAFAIQLSDGRERIVVNCGSIEPCAADNADLDMQALSSWHNALAGADAHSTLCVQTAHRIGAGAASGQGKPLYHRLEEDRQGQLLELERQNVAGAPGATHRRRLYLSVDGDDLRGEDVLVPPAGFRAAPFVLRFHLHPGIRASLSRDGRSIILVTPRKEGWTFIANGAALTLEKSLYCGAERRKQPTSQIVVTPAEAGSGPVQVKWAFRKAGLKAPS